MSEVLISFLNADFIMSIQILFYGGNALKYPSYTSQGAGHHHLSLFT